ncbi:MAG: pirin family protein [Armatimonadetes bacterium]|nr:pirin family protein [Akkermansiaceae bacterium]
MEATERFEIKRANERGHAKHGWLESRHSFSFGDYYDPEQMGFRSLRVINDDRVAPGMGFPKHPHRDMEIFSYVLEGQLAHEDSMGNRRVLKPGEIQMMRAGSGVTHSEYNPSRVEPAHFLQVWIVPNEKGLEPAYTEWTPEGKSGGKLLVISEDGREGSAKIAQDASVFLLKLKPGEQVEHELHQGRGLWLQMACGKGTIDTKNLEAGDALFSEAAGIFAFQAGDENVEAILFDLG